ncbi:MAG TPA: SDR family oxidoreductase [Thermoanaerobaculia bacterium]|nr:SDR family oxidoreductase [Thermoanaerobaculia bacterium]
MPAALTADARSRWALVLGASSGFGEACSLELARSGWNVFGVHLDRKATLPNVERIVAEIRAAGRRAEFFNVNAADDEKRAEVVAAIQKTCGGDPPESRVSVLLHSLAFGTLKPFFAEPRENAISKPQIEMTLDVMASSLVYWTQDLFFGKLLAPGARIFAMTSAGDHIVWPAYGAVSAAKSALESYVRQLSVELAPHKVAVNALRAGVTDTPALRKIPGNEAMIERVTAMHPAGRLTVPSDVAKALVALCGDGGAWVSGNVIGVDGAEDVAGGR